jgi:DNA polymerase III sliding clamp (beta) subunit (PCNA family)
MLIEKEHIKKLPRIGNNIGFKFQDNKCYVIVFNEFSYFATELEVDDDSIPDFFVDMKLFLGIVNAVGDMDISIKDTSITIKDQLGSSFKLPKKIEEFSSLIKFDWDKTNSLSDDFALYLKHLLSSSSEQPTLDYREGIFFSSDILASTDGVTITIADNTIFDLVSPLVLHRQFVSNLQGESYIYITDNSLHFCKEKFWGGSLVLSTSFPNVKGVEDGVEYVDYFTIDGSELTTLLTKSKPLTADGYDVLHFTLIGGSLDVEYRSPYTGDFDSSLNAETTRNVDFHVNGDRLLRVIKPFGDTKIKVWFADNVTPLKIEREEEGSSIRKIVALSVP